MASTTDSKTVVIVDDEQHNMVWLNDYLKELGYSVEIATTANQAILVLSQEIYRATIIDLNIPLREPLRSTVVPMGEVYVKYPGLYVAHFARNEGYRDRQVIVYSVHKDAAVAQEIERLGCTYIIKGRPREIKRELMDVLQFDPTKS